MIVIAIIVVGLGSWYWKSYIRVAPVQTPQQTSTSVPTHPAVVQSLVFVKDAKFGKHLTAAQNGMTLYSYAKDKPKVSNCYDVCAENWPPYLISPGAMIGSPALDVVTKLSTTTRSDGTSQIAYDGAPLYFWSKDTKPGDMTGNGINGLWSVIKK